MNSAKYGKIMNKIIKLLVHAILVSSFLPLLCFAALQDSSNLRPPVLMVPAQPCSTSFFSYLGMASADSDRFINQNFGTYQDIDPFHSSAGDFTAVVTYLNQPVDYTHLPAGVLASITPTTQLNNICPGVYTVVLSIALQNISITIGGWNNKACGGGSCCFNTEMLAGSASVFSPQDKPLGCMAPNSGVNVFSVTGVWNTVTGPLSPPMIRTGGSDFGVFVQGPNSWIWVHQ